MGNGIWNTINKLEKENNFYRWPNPFNAIKQVDVMACNPEFWVRVEFYAKVAAEFWWTNFVPSPIEITRRWVLGKFKCGAKAKTNGRGKMDILPFRNTRVTVAGIASPVLRGLFYWWAANTAWAALDTWSSILNAQANCDADMNMAIIRDGHASIAGIGQGSPAFGQVTWDPNGWAVANICAVGPPAGVREGFASVTLCNVGSLEPIEWECWLQILDSPIVKQSGTLGLDECANIMVGNRWDGNQGVQVVFRSNSDIPAPFGRLECFLNRLVVSYWENDPPDRKYNLFDPYEETPNPFPNCLNRFQSDFNPPT